MTGAVDRLRFEHFCIVGLGQHARTKLIPALRANAQKIVGVVTRQSDGVNGCDAQVFRRLDTALSALPADTVFVIATPPAMHFSQALRVLEAGRDLFIEKPAFVTAAQARRVITMAAGKSTVMVEAFMHRHTELYRRLMTFWRGERTSVKGIEVAFLVPELPVGTFRQGSDIADSSLYDIGCYALSLLADLGLPIDMLALTSCDFSGSCERESLRLAGELNGVLVDIRVGVGATYVNSVSFLMDEESDVTFSPVFYGRPGERGISHSSSGQKSIRETINEGNAFEAMFAIPRSVWLGDQSQRDTTIIEITTALERLGHTLAALRVSGRA
jgi:hypothetical protein